MLSNIVFISLLFRAFLFKKSLIDRTIKDYFNYLFLKSFCNLKPSNIMHPLIKTIIMIPPYDNMQGKTSFISWLSPKTVFTERLLGIKIININDIALKIIAIINDALSSIKEIIPENNTKINANIYVKLNTIPALETLLYFIFLAKTTSSPEIVKSLILINPKKTVRKDNKLKINVM